MGSAVKDRGGCLKLIPKSYKEQTKKPCFHNRGKKKNGNKGPVSLTNISHALERMKWVAMGHWW